ncbi:MAG: hypothetical protein U5N53_09000 [Mycobacterium sp.]|nr:hypothetical protein [Mycobacterium sp.]
MAGTQTSYTGPTKTYRSSYDMFRPSGLSAHGGVIYIDLTDAMNRLSKALSVYSEEVQRRALYNAINKLGDKLLTAVRRDVVAETGAKYGRVMRAIKADRAHPNRLFYRIKASDRAMPLSDFARSLTPGRKNPRAAPWNKSRSFRGAFIIKFKSGATEIVKRIGRHNKNGKIKMLWGPIIPKEMIRPGNPSTNRIASAIPAGLEPVLMHELTQAVARAKAASGT